MTSYEIVKELEKNGLLCQECLIKGHNKGNDKKIYRILHQQKIQMGKGSY